MDQEHSSERRAESSFHIRKMPEPASLTEDALSSFISQEEQENYVPIDAQNQPETSETALCIVPSAFARLEEYIGWKTVTQQNQREQGGILVGRIFRDSASGCVWGVVMDVIHSQMSGNETYIQFSHDDWISMYREFEERYPVPEGEAQNPFTIIGWYHTHPRMPVRMSAIDRQTHVGFFAGEGQFSVILNPQWGIWSVFNGSGCQNCRGLLYCPPEVAQRPSLRQAESAESREDSSASPGIFALSTDVPQGSFVIKRRSAPPAPQRVVMQIPPPVSRQRNARVYPNMRQRYSGEILSTGNTCYYFPVNKNSFTGQKSYIISDSLVRRLANQIVRGITSNDELALFYRMMETPSVLVTDHRIGYYSFSFDNNLTAEGVAFSSASGGYVEFCGAPNMSSRLTVSLAAVYSVAQPDYEQLRRQYGNYDCVLHINMLRTNEFSFYVFDRQISNARMSPPVPAQQVVARGSDFLGSLIEKILNCYNEIVYSETEYTLETDGKSPLYIRNDLIAELFRRVRRYERSEREFAVVLSYQIPGNVSENRNVVCPLTHEFLRVLAFSGRESKGLSLKQRNWQLYEGTSRMPKFAFVLSNKDVSLHFLRSKLIGHLCAICLNLETKDYRFYRLY